MPAHQESGRSIPKKVREIFSRVALAVSLASFSGCGIGENPVSASSTPTPSYLSYYHVYQVECPQVTVPIINGINGVGYLCPDASIVQDKLPNGELEVTLTERRGRRTVTGDVGMANGTSFDETFALLESTENNCVINIKSKDWKITDVTETCTTPSTPTP